MKIGDYLPDDADEEVDILVRYPQDKRDIGRFDQLRVKTAAGLVPITNFAQIKPDHKQDTIRRVDGRRVVNIKADMVEGYNLALELPKITAEVAQLGLPAGIEFKIRGQNEEQENSSAFLQNAFMVALGVMALILITQFNSFYQAFLILSASAFLYGRCVCWTADFPKAIRHYYVGHWGDRTGRDCCEQQYCIDRYLQSDA